MSNDPFELSTAIGAVPSALPLPAVEQDLAVLAWLQSSDQLSGDTGDYIVGALLRWCELQGSWPDPAPPAGGAGRDHLSVLEQVAERWAQRTATAGTVSRVLEMAGVGRQLSYAIWCQRNPEGLRDSLWRELVQREPWRAAPPAPVVFADGSML